MNLIKLAIIRVFGNVILLLFLDILLKLIGVDYEVNISGIAVGATFSSFFMEYESKSGVLYFESKKWQGLGRSYWLKWVLFTFIFLIISIAIYSISNKIGNVLLFIGNIIFIVPFNFYLTYRYVVIPFQIKKGIIPNDKV